MRFCSMRGMGHPTAKPTAGLSRNGAADRHCLWQLLWAITPPASSFAVIAAFAPVKRQAHENASVMYHIY